MPFLTPLLPVAASGASIVVTSVDGDDIFLVAQTGVTVSGAGLDVATGARVRVGSYTLNMENYAAGSSPTFNAPSLATVLSSGVPLGSVTLDLLRTA